MAHGDVRIMLPLINDIGEVQAVRVLLERYRDELAAEGYAVPETWKLGAMVETPAAALSARELARHVDFFSVGTNDLVQYTLAVDRGNSRLAKKYDPFHPAVVRLMDMTARAGLEAGIEVGVCGEVAANPLAAFMLIGMRVGSLSVGPASLAEIKKVIRSVTYELAAEAVEEALAAETPDEVVRALTRRLGSVLDLSKFAGPWSLSAPA